MAIRAGRDPLAALGIPEEVAQLPEVAHLIVELIVPPRDGQQSETELDAAAERIKERQDREAEWDAALPGGTGYRGKRGQLLPPVPKLSDPLPDMFAPVVHTGRPATMPV